MADDFKVAQPHQYHRLFLRESIRPDGRAVTSCRDIKLHVNSISTALGSSMVCFGDTRVIAGIKGRFAQPDIDRPGEGFVVPNVTLPSLCNSKYRPGMPSDTAVAMSCRLAAVLDKVVDKTQLCVRPGKTSWCLYVDAVCLNDDGNVWDALLLATSAALKSAILPATQYCAETDVVAVDRDGEGVKLKLNHLPVSVTLSVFDGTTIPDPTGAEERIEEGSVTCCVDQKGAIRAVWSSGHLPDELISGTLKYAVTRADILCSILQKVTGD